MSIQQPIKTLRLLAVFLLALISILPLSAQKPVQYNNAPIQGLTQLGVSSDATLVVSDKIRGNKRYELSNHLDNILSTLSDRKIPVNGAGIVVFFVADVSSSTDYYPYGMSIPERASVKDYRYGFNGKEDDGDLAMQDYGFRHYNPQIARFISWDPLAPKYPWLSPYQFASLTPIAAADLDGLEADVKFNMIIDYNTAVKLAGPDATGAEIQKVYNEIHYSGSPLTLEGLHMALDAAGFVPIIGEVADGINALIYVVEGDWVNAGISAMAIIPIIGDAGKVSKYVVKYGDDFYDAGTTMIKNADELQGLKKFDDFGKVKSPCGCFTAGTFILTHEGLKHIEDIGSGDRVLSFNDSTQQTEFNEVAAVFTLEREGYYELFVGDDVLKVTDDHPFYVDNQWKPVAELKVGDYLITPSQIELKIDRIKYVPESVKVYNFEVKGNHNYYVGQQSYLVHNTDPCDLIIRQSRQANSKVIKDLGLKDGMKMDWDTMLDKAQDFLGPGYKEVGENTGRYMSKDGTRVVRMGDGDILGKHGGGPHMNFETLIPNKSKPGKMKVDENLHIFEGTP